MIRMRREGGQLRTSDTDEPVLDDDLGWNQISRRARERGLAPPTVDSRTQEYVYAQAPSKEEAERLWKFNAKTQWDALRRAHAGLVRLGELDPSEPLVMPYGPPTVPAPKRAPPTTPPPTPVPSSAETEPMPPATPTGPEPKLKHELGPEQFAISLVATEARERGEWFKLAVATRVLEGTKGLDALQLSPATRSRAANLTDEEALKLARKWVAEARSRATP